MAWCSRQHGVAKELDWLLWARVGRVCVCVLRVCMCAHIQHSWEPQWEVTVTRTLILREPRLLSRTSCIPKLQEWDSNPGQKEVKSCAKTLNQELSLWCPLRCFPVIREAVARGQRALTEASGQGLLQGASVCVFINHMYLNACAQTPLTVIDLLLHYQVCNRFRLYVFIIIS